jgi:hypothetical protein
MRPRRLHRLPAVLAGLAIAAISLPSVTSAQTPSGYTPDQGATLLAYARTTWASFDAMTDPDTGLPADSLSSDGTQSVQTSTTNIGAYMWSTVVAERLGIVGHREATSRLDRTLTTLAGMDRHEPSGQFYNWYDHTNGNVLTVWPPTGAPVKPILSSVDNGWLATGLKVVASAEASMAPAVAAKAKALYDSMDFGFYYRPSANRIAFFYAPSDGESPCCYDTIVSESRIASYIGIAKGEIPQKEYFGAWRTFPNTCDWSWQETKPVGFDATYLGVKVFEGAYPYDGFRVVPGWGGSMFEALMPALFVPEETWGSRSWAINHPLTVAAQIHHGLVDAGYGVWGFSPSNIPEGGYNAYGVDAIGMNPDGYFSNEDNTGVDRGFAGCPGRDPRPDPLPAAYTNGVVTPHAAFLALRWAPRAGLADLARLKEIPGMYDRWGFHDSVNVQDRTVSDSYLALDQGIIEAAIGNALDNDVLRRAFASQDVRSALLPVMAMETFNAGPRDRAVDVDVPRD